MSSIELILRKINAFLEKGMSIITPSGIVIGLLLGNHISFLKPLVIYLFAFISLVGGFGVSIPDFFKVIRKPLPIFLFLLSSYFLFPSLVWISMHLWFPSQPDTMLGFFLLCSVPTAVVSYVWSSIYKGEAALSLTLLIIGTVLSPLCTPLIMRILSGSGVDFNVTGMVFSLFKMVLLPSALGILINQVTQHRVNDHVTPCLKPFTKVAIFVLMAINASQLSESFFSTISLSLLPIIIGCLLFTFVGFLLARLLAHISKLNREQSISLMFASGLRNINAALVLAIDFFSPAVAIPVMLGIFFQQIMSAVSATILLGKEKKAIHQKQGVSSQHSPNTNT
ncbi:MAG: bile acid:sodium symporter family protein [Sphaerochaeta sp.]|jgi:tagaturonate reductase|nr:bile acid:sodium symporter family protein [Sphaerochaeta sp.]